MAAVRERMGAAVVLGLLAMGVALCTLDSAARWREGGCVTSAETFFYETRSAAFPEAGHPDVAVHVPRGFDPARRPGAIVYFHGWNGCVQVALGDEDAPCSADGPPRLASRLSTQLDEAGVNALLVAVELRVDAPTGEVGELSQPGGLRMLLDEVLRERLSRTLDVMLDVDSLDRIVIVTHSGGYQAAAAALRFGDLPHVTEVVLLDALYGADEALDDVLHDRSIRLVNLYTSSGGTRDRSLRMAEVTRALGRDLFTDDGESDLQQTSLSHEIVLKHVPQAHSDLPRTYTRAILAAARFAVVP
jgi:hypothetical protein